MEFRLDEGQVELQQTVARFCADRFPLDALVAREGAPVDRRALGARWPASACSGCCSPRPTAAAASAPSRARSCSSSSARHLAPGPVLWTVLAAPLVDGAADGERLVGGRRRADARRRRLGRRRARRRPRRAARRRTTTRVVAHRTTADLAPPSALDPLDPLTPVGRFDGLRRRRRRSATPRRRPSCGSSARCSSAAMLVGVASRAPRGRPRLRPRAPAVRRADRLVPGGQAPARRHVRPQRRSPRAPPTLPRPWCRSPAATTRSGRPRPPSCSPARPAIANAGTAVQVLGGMGFTWDMLPNYLLKRAWVLEHAFGAADDHAAAPRRRARRRRRR